MPGMLKIVLIIILTGLGLGFAGVLRDRGVSPAVTRWLASLIGGLAYLVTVRWLDVWSAVAISALTVLLIAGLRRWRAGLLRGLRESVREQSRAELGFPAAATAALAIGWGLFHDPGLAFVAIAFMAWGDGAAGLVRGWRSASTVRNIAASATMLSVSLGSAWLIYPSTAGAAAAVVATGVEAVWPITGSRLSDSWPVVGSTLGLILLLGGTPWTNGMW